MLLTETKIQSEAYFHNRLGYNLTCLMAHFSSAGGAQGGFVLVTMEQLVGWGVDSTYYHRPNMVSCKIVTGLTCTPIIRSYLPPSMLEHMPDLEEALQRFKDPVVFGVFNVDLDKARSS